MCSENNEKTFEHESLNLRDHFFRDLTIPVKCIPTGRNVYYYYYYYYFSGIDVFTDLTMVNECCAE